ncbi:unnamed protein product [Clonostachys chloroleuca]|uniref:Uncharacterized protein n=1 Tax=Clonostachys chloroleuca TaxID=1926264 RepID=A0AA35M9M0_9HYPO|nr:unnamed protein product [Clonostachys chloroleuca]
MSPFPPPSSPLTVRSSTNQIENIPFDTTKIVEAWAQGFNVGALVLLILFTLCNYRRHVLLHKLILIQLVLSIWHGAFVFFNNPVYGWLLSSTAILLYVAYNIHNVISWMKIKPFLPPLGGKIFLISLLLVQPYWILETFANFQYFNLEGSIFEQSRFYEPLARDPWWIFTTVKLVWVIKRNYEYTLIGLVRNSPRFGIMLLCMFISIVFLITDVAVTATVSTDRGINPYWRFSLVFKCASDTIFLDDFKSVLDRIASSTIKRLAHIPNSSINGPRGSVTRQHGSFSHQEFRPGHSVSVSANPQGSSGYSKYARVPWVGQRLAPQHERHSDELGLQPIGDSKQSQIRAETTIEVSEQGGKEPKPSTSTGAGSRKEFGLGSEDDVLLGRESGLAERDFGWVEMSPRSGAEGQADQGGLGFDFPREPSPTQPRNRT